MLSASASGSTPNFVWVVLIIVLSIMGLDAGDAGWTFKVALVVLLALQLVSRSPEIDANSRESPTLQTVLGVIVFWVLVVCGLQAFFVPVNFSAWMSDATTYLLLAGFLAALDRPRITLVQADRMVVLGTILASAAFAITWTSRRGIGAYGEVYMLGSKALLMVFVSLAFARAISRSDSVKGAAWALLSALPVVAVLLTGTRSGLFLLPVYVGGLVFGSRGAKLQSIFRLGLVILIVALGTSWASSEGFLLDDSAPESFAQDRLGTVLGAAASGGLDDGLTSGRLAVADAALQAFVNHPLFGSGFGAIFSVDSSAVTLAKFGLVGSVLLAFCLARILRLGWVRASREEDRIAVGGVLFGVLSLSIVAAVLEDRGLGLGLGILLLSIRAGSRSSATSEGEATVLSRIPPRRRRQEESV